MRRPESLRGFALRLVLILIPAYLLWAWVEPLALRSLWMLSDVIWPRIFSFSSNARVDVFDGGWRIHTYWPIAAVPGQPSGFASPDLALSTIKHIVSGFPLLLALMLATRGRSWQRTGIALSCHAVLAWLAISASLWHTLVVMSGTYRDLFAAVAPPAYRLAIDPAPVWTFYLSGYLMYLSLLVIPYLAPIVLWLCLMRRELALMITRLQHRRRQRQLD